MDGTLNLATHAPTFAASHRHARYITHILYNTSFHPRHPRLIALQGEKARPDTVLYQAVDTAVKSGADLVLCDTSGRLHTNWSLMVRGCCGPVRLGMRRAHWCGAAH